MWIIGISELDHKNEQGMSYTLWVGEIKDNTLNNILISSLKCKYNNNLALDGSFRLL